MHTGRRASGHGSGWIRTLHGRRGPPLFEGMKGRETGKGLRSGRPACASAGKNSCYGDPHRGQRRGFFPLREKEFLYAPQRPPYGKSGNSGRHGKEMKEESGDRAAPIWKETIRKKREWQARGCSLLSRGLAHGAYKECAPGCNMAGGMMGKGRLAFAGRPLSLPHGPVRMAAGRIRRSASEETGFRIG